MPKVETAVVEGAVTGTFHDGTNMIVLHEGRRTKVAASSLGYLRERRLIKTNPLDHDNSGKAGGSKRRSSGGGKRPRSRNKPPANPDLVAARAEYKAAFNKNPSPRLDAAAVRAKIAEKRADTSQPSGGEGGAPAS